jgi:hypothetical protein
MANHEIPNAFLVRALARGVFEHCEGCGSRMFVKPVTGKCPYCRAGYPPQVVHRDLEPANLPFAPRLGERVVVDGWVTRLLTWLLVAWTRRQRRSESGHLALATGETPHPSTS